MKRRFGLEMECISKISRSALARKIADTIGAEKVDSQNFSYHSHRVGLWGIEADSSLSACSSHGYPYTAEIITPPLRIHQLGDLRKVLTALAPNITVNRTCGLHVHFEMSSVQEVKKVLLVWRHFENEIVKIFPSSRRRNHYCRQLSRAPIENVLNMHVDRYSMVNPGSYAIRGTIEFRGHQGTVSYQKIKRWILFLNGLIDSIQHIELNDLPPDIIERGNEGVLRYTQTARKTAAYFNGRVRHFEKMEAAA